MITENTEELTRISVLIPASGQSTRMGDHDKLLLKLNGETLLRAALRKAVRSVAHEVMVVLRATAQARIAETRGLPVRAVYSTSEPNLMSASIIAGLDAISEEAQGVLIMLPDMPAIETSDLNRLVLSFKPGRILRACTADLRLGHPVLFSRNLFPQMKQVAGDVGPRSVIKAHGHLVDLMPLEGNRAIVDLDTPDDWQEYTRRELTGAGEGT